MLLINAARDGDTETVRTLLSSAEVQSFINYQDASGATPLHTAAREGHEAVTKQLIEARCNVDLQANDGCTPLHIAAHQGLLMCCYCLADEIQKLKELGDKAVKRSNWEDAIEHYTSGIEIFRRARDLEVEDGEEAQFYR